MYMHVIDTLYNVLKLFNHQETKTEKTSNCVGEMGRWGEVLR